MGDPSSDQYDSEQSRYSTEDATTDGESKSHLGKAPGTFVLHGGVLYQSAAWKKWPWRERWTSSRVVRARIMKHSFSDWSPEETKVITSTPLLWQFLNSPSFEAGISLLIILNSVVMGFKVDDDDQSRALYVAADHIFTTLYLLEWTGNMVSEGFMWLAYWPHIFDTLVVFGGGVGPAWLLPLAQADNSSTSGGMYKLFRIMRLLRINRLLKMIRQRDLWMLVAGIVACMRSFFYALVILTGYFYVAGIFIRVVINSEPADFLEAEDKDVERFFSDVPSVMWFLFIALTDGVSWAPIVQSLTDKSPMFYMYFAVIMAIGQLVLLNLITAIIVEHAIGNATLNAEDEAAEAEKTRKKIVNHIIELFRDADTDGSDTVDRLEFTTMLRTKSMKCLMRVLEIDDTGDELLELFDVCDTDNSGHLSLQEYQSMFFKMMRPPAAKDVLRILAMLERLDMKIEEKFGDPERAPGSHHLLWNPNKTASTPRASATLQVADNLFPSAPDPILLPNETPESARNGDAKEYVDAKLCAPLTPPASQAVPCAASPSPLLEATLVEISAALAGLSTEMGSLRKSVGEVQSDVVQVKHNMLDTKSDVLDVKRRLSHTIPPPPAQLAASPPRPVDSGYLAGGCQPGVVCLNLNEVPFLPRALSGDTGARRV